jgi:hypothetical protein
VSEIAGVCPQLLKRITRPIRLTEVKQQEDKCQPCEERGLHRGVRDRFDAV